MKKIIMKKILLTLLITISIIPISNAVNKSWFNPVWFHGYGISYWGQTHFANWLYSTSWEWEDIKKHVKISHINKPDQINKNWYPIFLNKGQILEIIPWQNMGIWNRPKSWPRINQQYTWRVKLTWKGNADIRVINWNQVFWSKTGSEINWIREYIMDKSWNGVRIQIHHIDINNPITDIKLWLPDPTDPNNKTLEGKLWHPYLDQMLKKRKWSFYRFMNENNTNGSPVRDWIDRRLPDNGFMNWVINPRSPAEGIILWTDKKWKKYYAKWNKNTWMPYEFMINLSNKYNLDMWINIPHLTVESKDNFSLKLAQLIKYGSDWVNPYTSKQANPIYPPLNSNLKVYVEYSNEIWSNWLSFPQWNYAQKKAKRRWITKEKWIAEKYSQTWRTFEKVLWDKRVINVWTIWTGNSYYTNKLINELYDNPKLLKPETISPTTYWWYWIQNWVYSKWWANKLYNDKYWESSTFKKDMKTTLNQLSYFVLSWKSYKKWSTWFDSVSNIWGFPSYVKDISLKRNIPIIAYEGGPSIYTNKLDLWWIKDDGITIFMEQMNREKYFADIYRAVLELWWSNGLTTHVMFTALWRWWKYWQWSHKEYAAQPDSESTKYQTILKFYDDHKIIWPINTSWLNIKWKNWNNIPPIAIWKNINIKFDTVGWNWKLTYEKILSYDAPWLKYNPLTRKLSWIATKIWTYYYFMRVNDNDWNVAYRNFTVNIIPKVNNTIFASDNFEGKIWTLNNSNTWKWFIDSWKVNVWKNNTDYMIDNNIILHNSNYATSKWSYFSSYRILDINWSFKYLASNEYPWLIGLKWTTLWFSIKIKRDKNAKNWYIIAFSDTDKDYNSTYNKPNHKIRIVVLPNWNWWIKVNNDLKNNFKIADTGILANNKLTQVVLSINFWDTNIINTYINPDKNTKLINPDATINTTKSIAFKTLVFFGWTVKPNQVLIDDIIFWDSFKSVTNILTQTIVPVPTATVINIGWWTSYPTPTTIPAPYYTCTYSYYYTCSHSYTCTYSCTYYYTYSHSCTYYYTYSHSCTY